jgi:hypothetical protein
MTDIRKDVMKYIVLSVAGCTLNNHKRNEETINLNICNENEIIMG